LAVSAVGEVEELSRNLLSRFLGVKLEWFQHGSVVLTKCESPSDLSKNSEEVVAAGTILRVEFSEARKAFEHDR